MTLGRSEPSRSEVASALDRVLADAEFRTSPRRASLLRHCVHEALEGRGDKLKETSIAMDVFGRSADFDPRLDTVVRAEARRLRQALASYYFGTGAEDPVVISMPKGTYVPQFAFRSAPEAQAPVDDLDTFRPIPSDDASVAVEGFTSDRSGGDLGPAMPAPRIAATRRSALVAILVAALVGIGGLLAVSGSRDHETIDAEVFAGPDVLVEPLDASGPLVGVETFAAGMTAQLIADLMRFGGFRVFDHQTSLDQHPGFEPTTVLADADFVVRGVMWGSDDDISLMVRLIDRSDGEVIWSDTFNRPLTPGSVSAMLTEVSGEIASKLGEPYGVIQGGTLAGERIDDAELSSFACVMQAYAYRHTNESANYPPVRACLEEAVSRDPDYADAWAMLAILRLDGGRFGYDGTTPELKASAFASARAAAARALALEPDNVAATNALAMIEHYAGRFDESLAYSQQAVELNPNDPSTLGYHGWRLAARGRFAEGIPFLNKAGDMEGMLTASQRASVDQSSVSDALLAIAYGGLDLGAEARDALDRMAQKWPLLAQDPATAFGWHNLHPEVIEALMDGLISAGWSPRDLDVKTLAVSRDTDAQDARQQDERASP
jgi:TolB-like protein